MDHKDTTFANGIDTFPGSLPSTVSSLNQAISTSINLNSHSKTNADDQNSSIAMVSENKNNSFVNTPNLNVDHKDTKCAKTNMKDDSSCLSFSQDSL